MSVIAIFRQLSGGKLLADGSDESMDLFVGAYQIAGIDLIPPSAAVIRWHESVNFPGLLVPKPLLIRREPTRLHDGYLFYPTA